MFWSSRRVEKWKLEKRRGGVCTRSAPDVHGFKVAGFDDAHSDGVGCGVVAQRHQQIPSTALQKRHTQRLLYNSGFCITRTAAPHSPPPPPLFCTLLNLLLLTPAARALPPSTCQPVHILLSISAPTSALPPTPPLPGAWRQPAMTSPITFCPISYLSSLLFLLSSQLPSCSCVCAHHMQPVAPRQARLLSCQTRS